MSKVSDNCIHINAPDVNKIQNSLEGNKVKSDTLCPHCGRTLILDSRTYAFYPCHVCKTQVPRKKEDADGE